LVTFAEQEVGTPDTCDHIFCVGCLKEWSKNVNTCPVDRQVFNAILVRRYSDREIVRRIPVRPGPRSRRNPYGRIFLLREPYCQVCGQCDGEDRMITCNGCRLVYHVECLIPLLHVIPVVHWLCPICILLSSVFYRDYVMRRGGRM
jgi:PHD and RING finger domain-containing protein 1